MKTYKIIPGPKSINVERGSFTDATDAFASMINAEAQQGWEFHSLETISVTQKEGCSLKPNFTNTSIYMLIFVRDE